jgi:hypothetical protein
MVLPRLVLLVNLPTVVHLVRRTAIPPHKRLLLLRVVVVVVLLLPLPLSRCLGLAIALCGLSLCPPTAPFLVCPSVLTGPKAKVHDSHIPGILPFPSLSTKLEPANTARRSIAPSRIRPLGCRSEAPHTT